MACLILILAIGAAIGLIDIIEWQSALTPISLLQMSAVFLCMSVTVAVGTRWWRGRRGLGQLPTPHGRFYDEWMRAETSEDYYPWLAKKMNWREPWATWAEMDTAVNGTTDEEPRSESDR